MTRALIAVLVCMTAVTGRAGAAPYATVLVYTKAGPSSTPLEVAVEDIMTGEHDNIVVPTQLLADDGSFYTLAAIKQRLDTVSLDKHYISPFRDFSVTVSVDNRPALRKARLSASDTEAQWQLPALTAGWMPPA